MGQKTHVLSPEGEGISVGLVFDLATPIERSALCVLKYPLLSVPSPWLFVLKPVPVRLQATTVTVEAVAPKVAAKAARAAREALVAKPKGAPVAKVEAVVLELRAAVLQAAVVHHRVVPQVRAMAVAGVVAAAQEERQPKAEEAEHLQH